MTRPSPSPSTLGVPSATRWLRHLACLLPLASTSALAMDHDTQLWMNVTAIGRIGTTEAAPSRCRYWLEGQTRFDQGIEHHFQHIVRPAVGFDITPRVTAWAGTT